MLNFSSSTKEKIIQFILDYFIYPFVIILHSFVIMPNHIHLLLTLSKEESKSSFQRDFLKFTSQQIIKRLIKEGKETVLKSYTSTQSDRIYQIWQRRSKWIEIENEPIFEQKLEYIHHNPLQKHWNLCSSPQAYKWSSAAFYETGEDFFDLLELK